MSSNGQSFALVVFFLQSGQVSLGGGIIPQESDGRFGKGPLEMGMANLAP
jgi:hypothetical protein